MEGIFHWKLTATSSIVFTSLYVVQLQVLSHYLVGCDFDIIKETSVSWQMLTVNSAFTCCIFKEVFLLNFKVKTSKLLKFIKMNFEKQEIIVMIYMFDAADKNCLLVTS